MRRALVLLALVVGLVVPCVARGEEPPCRREGERVSCSGDGFKLLTDACTEAKAEAQVCALRLADAGKEAAAWRGQFEACLAAVPPPGPPKSPARPLVGYALGLVGVAVGAVAFGLSFDAAPRALLGTLGLSAVLGGGLLVLP